MSEGGKLQIISAGAGAGKTTDLSNRIVAAVQSGVPAQSIMATTFTIKAADELIERVRIKLLEAGNANAATRILDGYVGTMNSVFGRLLREFALELGMSPVQTVLPEREATALFQSVVGTVLNRYYRDYRKVFRRLQMQDSWRGVVLSIIEKARQNKMSAEDVRACANYSWTTLSAWLPAAEGESSVLNDALYQSMQNVRSMLPGGDTTKRTAQVLDTINDALREWEQYDDITWQRWAQLAKLKPGARSQDIVQDLIRAAQVHDKHPGLHQDMRQAIEVVFYCAAEAMQAYAEEKSQRGLVDFTDQESLALELLLNEDYGDELRHRIRHVFVDEFQDSSPLQLALNTRLRGLAQSATWVGDVKQAIFGFRGTDPSLMNLAMDQLQEVDVSVLDTSYRSRQRLVEFVNAVFVPAFGVSGMAPDRVALKPNRSDDGEQGMPLETWLFPSARNQTQDMQCLAKGVADMLRQPDHYPIKDRVSKQLRNIRPGDIAVLCRSNAECEVVAEALSAVGIVATVGKNGLFSTPEAILAMAALRYLVDERDTLALAELLHFASSDWSEGRWLSKWLESDQPRSAFEHDEYIEALNETRQRIAHMSPAEVLDVAITAAKIDELVLRWGQGNDRLVNLDKLRSLATQYEDVAETNDSAASAGGLVLFLQEAGQQGSEMNQVADTTNDAAVNVMTYHRAKGLEWPVVILSSLFRGSERKIAPVFDAATAVSTTGFDVNQPLSGRRLYFWPWPYGQQSTNVGLDGHVQSAPEYMEAKQRLLEENRRLLYVGMTRARDYLILATRTADKGLWLKELKDENDRQILELPEDPVNQVIAVKGQPFDCRVRVLSPADEDIAVQKQSESQVFVAEPSPVTAPFVPATFRASGLTDEDEVDSVQSGSPHGHDGKAGEGASELVTIGNRFPLTGDVDMAQLGDMVHAFLAADDRDAAVSNRLSMASALQQRFGIHAIPADAMVEASDRLHRFIKDHYGDVISKHHEWPIHLRRGLQTASGWIDLLIETQKGWVIVDHKSFPGKISAWVAKAESYLPQLRVYRDAVVKATGKPVIGAWIHMPVVGAMVGFKMDDVSGEESAG
ncbi:exodeoxyribonuclease V subunit beta [Alicyclobacillus sp. SO9]|uniref:UvrD-helicase domain-containing protein n=1 Tax=Alicyclobacillus sp. SO9 TaxID=2665646 RepID=UPI0018E7F086|nr:UvrD-helicase domain-containing protein [Alicyclobacillus sp. SO9]QQE80464.1 UvrD-helicase domain-containing protein [Alicyclobacillus sp. SO9]